MAEVITLAKLPEGRDNKFIITEEQKQFYIDNNETMTMADIASHIGISSATMYVQIKEHNLPSKVRVFQKKEMKYTEFFSWENATIMDWAFGIQGQVRF